jgi:carbonic anhydrase
MVNYEPGSSISVGEKKYVLKQFHFHRPSEEKINGKATCRSWLLYLLWVPHHAAM